MPKSSTSERLHPWTRIRFWGPSEKLGVADECYPAASVASEVASIFADEGFGLLKKSAKRINFPVVPVPLSPPLEEYLIPRVDKLIAAAKQLVG